MLTSSSLICYLSSPYATKSTVSSLKMNYSTKNTNNPATISICSSNCSTNTFPTTWRFKKSGWMTSWDMPFLIYDISRIDMHAPRLAPREKSNSEVYHRYRAFYGHVSSSFYNMTQRAIQSAKECIVRTVSLLNGITLISNSDVPHGDGDKTKTPISMQHAISLSSKKSRSAIIHRRRIRKMNNDIKHKNNDMDVLKRQFSGYNEDRLISHAVHNDILTSKNNQTSQLSESTH